ncbi:MAG: DMT family transporter [Cyclobacteriaceae bacterium]|nr:DMT family transporter [Cyclobacteriaceae bacterium]
MSKGVKYMLLAGVFFAVMNVMVKGLSHLPAVEIVFFRSAISLIISFVVLKRARVSLIGNQPWILFLRGFFGLLALSMFFWTLQELPLGAAVTIQYLSPIFASALGIFIVKEKVKPYKWVFFGIAFAGVVMIEGFDPRVSPFFLVVGLISAIFAGLAYNMVRLLKDSEHPVRIVFYFPLVSLPLTGIYILFDWVTPLGWDWLLILFMGISTQIAQVYMTKAFQSDEVSKIALLKYAGIFYAVFFGHVFFEEVYTLQVYIGMVVVLLGIVGNVLYKQRKEQAQTP